MAKAFIVAVLSMIKYAFWKNWIFWGNFHEFGRKIGTIRAWILYETVIKYAHITLNAHTLSGGLWMKTMHSIISASKRS
jgi:hypothetical protein